MDMPHFIYLFKFIDGPLCPPFGHGEMLLNILIKISSFFSYKLKVGVLDCVALLCLASRERANLFSYHIVHIPANSIQGFKLFLTSEPSLQSLGFKLPYIPADKRFQ